MADFRVIVTGSRETVAVDPELVRFELNLLLTEYGRRLFVKVGDCKTGVDHITRDWCSANGVMCEAFVAEWSKYDYAAGPLRNGNMVRSGADFCLALNAGKRPIKRTGTGDCSCQAIDAHIRTLTVYVGKGPLPPSERSE